MDYLDFAVATAYSAGEVLRHYAPRNKQVELKGRSNLVTVADRESEALIVGEIKKRFRDHRILTEESGFVLASESVSDDAPRWIIDPLDGTTNYAHQFPVYSVSIALEINGVLECGVVYDPVRDEMFQASRGGGAWLNREPIVVSDVRALIDGLILTGFPYGVRERVGEALALFRAFLLGSQAVRRVGSAALDLCYVAAGRSDGFWELDLHPWDTAAGVLVLEEAGGRLSDFLGAPFRIEGKAIVASNGKIHEEMLETIATAIGR